MLRKLCILGIAAIGLHAGTGSTALSLIHI